MFSGCKGTIKRREYKIKSNIFIFILECSTLFKGTIKRREYKMKMEFLFLFLSESTFNEDKGGTFYYNLRMENK